MAQFLREDQLVPAIKPYSWRRFHRLTSGIDLCAQVIFASRIFTQQSLITMPDISRYFLEKLEMLLIGSFSSDLLSNPTRSEGFRLFDKSQVNEIDFKIMLLSAPFTAVDSNAMPSYERMKMLLDFGQNKGFASNWAILEQPLLTQDLTVIVLSAVSSSSSSASCLELCTLLAFARLAQILIQPGSREPALSAYFSPQTGISFVTNETTDQLGRSLLNLQQSMFQELYPTACLPHNKLAELAAYVLDSWIPFLEFLFVVQISVLGQPPQPSGDTKGDDYEDEQNQFHYVKRLLSDLGLSFDIRLFVESPSLIDLSRRWCIHLNVANKSRNISQIPNFVPIKPIASSESRQSTADTSRKRTLNADSPKGHAEAEDEGNTLIEDNIYEEQNEGMESQSVSDSPMNDESSMLPAASAGDWPLNQLSSEDFVQLQQLLENEGVEGTDSSSWIMNWMLGLMNSTNTGVSSAGASSAAVIPSTTASFHNEWKLEGVDPEYRYIDNFLGETFSEERLTNIHSYSPLQGCVSGLYAVNGINGDQVEDFFCDLSCGLGSRRHRGHLIKLPNLYTDIYQMVGICTC